MFLPVYYAFMDENYYICGTNIEKKRMNKPIISLYEIVNKAEYREILFARIAGGDLYAMESYIKVKQTDIALDIFREKPIYSQKRKNKKMNELNTIK